MAAGRRTGLRAAIAAALAASLAAIALSSPSQAAVTLKRPGETTIDRSEGRFVPVPASIPHAEGAYVDRRLIGQLQWITDHFDVYVMEGFAGKLPSGVKIGCPRCHVEGSEHKIGLGVDLVPLVWDLIPYDYDDGYDYDVPCDSSWDDTTLLARWAEPVQGSPRRPFRWVGYDGDANHGCGNHLHLSWIHDPDYAKYVPSNWVEVFKLPQ